MCIAWPMRVTEITPDRHGFAELDGVKRRIGLRLLPGVQVGDFVLVHAGYAIEAVEPEKAAEQLALYEEIKRAMQPEQTGKESSL